jgi:hypothetical protein
MKTTISMTLFFIYALAQLSGCSRGLYQTDYLSKNPSPVYVDVNNPKFGVELMPGQLNKDGTPTYKMNNKNGVISFQVNKGDVVANLRHFYITPNIEFGDDKAISVKYHYSHRNQAPNVYINVEFPNSRDYTAALDTGYMGVALLTSDIVLDNKLAIWSYGFDINSASGVCQIPELKMGSIKSHDIVGHYTEQQWQSRFLNRPLYKESAVILGLHFIRTFDYVIFDNINKDVVFSKDGAFTPDNSDLWQSYPFEIKQDLGSNERIMVQMPINGKVYELFFDSCGAKPGLILNKNHWQTIKKNLNFKLHGKDVLVTGFGIKMPIQKVTLSEISIGEKTIKNADVYIFDEPERLSMLSLGYFQDNAVVLDFVNNLLWIKK